jgi:hypothetical protein
MIAAVAVKPTAMRKRWLRNQGQAKEEEQGKKRKKR